MITESELAEVLRLAMDRSNAKVRTVLPARITAFDPTNGPTASVQPVVQAFYWDVDLEEPVAYELPEITNCPVHYPAGGGFQITYPLDVGDDCFILVAERSIDEWMATGNATNIPRILRRFDLSDAIVIPGLAPRARPLANVDADSLVVRHSAGAILRINDNGKVYLGNSTIDLLSTVEDFRGATEAMRVAINVFAGALSGAVDPIVVSAGSALGITIAALSTSFAAVQAKLTAITE